MSKKNVIALYCDTEKTVLARYTTNCPIKDARKISELVQDGNINNSEGDEVNKFVTIVLNLGYTIEEVIEETILI